MINYVFNRVSTPPQVDKIERRFPYSSYKRKSYISLENCNNKNKKYFARWSKEECKSSGKSIFHKNVLVSCEHLS